MMNAAEQEYMDYLIHNRMELTKQNTRWLEEIEQLEKKLAIAVKALQFYADTTTWWCCHEGQCAYVDGSVARQALKEMEETNESTCSL